MTKKGTKNKESRTRRREKRRQDRALRNGDYSHLIKPKEIVNCGFVNFCGNCPFVDTCTKDLEHKPLLTFDNNGAQLTLSKVGAYWMVQISFIDLDTLKQGDKQTVFISFEPNEAITLMLRLDMWLSLNI